MTIVFTFSTTNSLSSSLMATLSRRTTDLSRRYEQQCRCATNSRNTRSKCGPRQRHCRKVMSRAELLSIEFSVREAALPHAAGPVGPRPFPSRGGWGQICSRDTLRILSFRPSQRVRPEVAGPMTGSARAGIHNHESSHTVSELNASHRDYGFRVALSRSSSAPTKWGRGTTPSVVEGARQSDAPSTILRAFALRMVPLPRFAGQERIIVLATHRFSSC